MDTKTIDIRGLEHNEHKNLIFPSIQELGKNTIFRIIVEFNPVPLVHMLESGDKFEIYYEKEGPGEWVLNIKRIASDEDNKIRFKGLQNDLKSEKSSERTKEKTKEFLQNVDAKTLGLVEQELIRKGIFQQEIWKNLHLSSVRNFR